MKRTTLALIGLFALLGVVAYLVTLKPGERSVSTEAGEPLFTVDSALVDKVEIRSTSGPVSGSGSTTSWPRGGSCSWNRWRSGARIAGFRLRRVCA